MSVSLLVVYIRVALYFRPSVNRVVTVLKRQKLKPSLSCKFKSYASENGEKVFKVDASIYYCQLRGCQVNSENEFNIIPHLNTDKRYQSSK